jgi:hypothetical protein
LLRLNIISFLINYSSLRGLKPFPSISLASITVINVIDYFIVKKCSVEIELNFNNCKFGITLAGFEYRDVWYDQDIIDWVQVKLEEYKL